MMMMALAIYGLTSWFFPSEQFLAIASGPVVTLGLIASYLLCRYGRFDKEELAKRKMRKPFVCLGAVTFIPIFLWMALCVGTPALITLFLGPNGEIVASVAIKTERGATKRNRLGLVGYSTLLKDRFWVPDEVFNYVHVGQDVSLRVREDFFGTRIFDIKARNQANPSLNRTRATNAALAG